MAGAGARGWLGSALMALGGLLLVVTIGLYGYGEYERVQFERAQAVRDRIDAATATTESLRAAYETARAGARARGTAEAVADASGQLAAAPSSGVPKPAAQPSSAPVSPGHQSPTPPQSSQSAAEAPPGLAVATPVPPPRRVAGEVPPAPPTLAATATPLPPPVVIRRIVARAISLDAPVVESKIENGEWVVPKFVAGHLEGTARPGSVGNVVLSGHVQSLISGNVFAAIDRLEPGDEVTLRTNLGEFAYRISGKNVVKNDDLSVVASSTVEELTLITCTGLFNPLTQDYSHRWVVWGERIT